MKKIILALCLLAGTFAKAQTDTSEQTLLNIFLHTKDDSAFITRYSQIPYDLYEIDRSMPTITPYTGEQDSIIFNALPDQLIGPFYTDEYKAYIKLVACDTNYLLHAGNLYVNPDKHGGKSKAKKIAKQLQKQAQSGAISFDQLCHASTDDNNPNPDCELKPFFAQVMVPEFSNMIIGKKAGEILLIESRYGCHVVKVLTPSSLQRYRVVYTMLVLKR